MNFPKTLSNPRLSSPIVLNAFPTLSVGPDVFAAAGSQVNLTADASDPDNDPLRMSWTRSYASSEMRLPARVEPVKEKLATLGDVLEKDVLEAYFVAAKDLPRWKYLKGAKPEGVLVMARRGADFAVASLYGWSLRSEF